LISYRQLTSHKRRTGRHDHYDSATGFHHPRRQRAAHAGVATFTQPDQLASFWGPHGNVIDGVELDVRPGGTDDGWSG
jgi:hypothetical protein